MCSPLKDRLRPAPVARVPGEHLGLTWRSASAEDVDRITSIVTRTECDDEVVRRTPLEEISRLVTTPNQQLDNLVGVDAAGITQAFGSVVIDANDKDVARAELFAVTTSRWRGRGIGRALLTWQDARARRMLVDTFGAESLLPARILNVVDSTCIDRRRLYAAAGFSPICTLSVMRRDDERYLPRTVCNPEVSTISHPDSQACWDIAKDNLMLRGATENQAQQWWERAHSRMDRRFSFLQRNNTDGTVMGCIVVVPHTSKWLAAGSVDASIELAVAAKDNPQVIGNLLEAALAAGKEHGITHVSAEVDVTNDYRCAHPFITRGFREVGKRSVYAIEL